MTPILTYPDSLLSVLLLFSGGRPPISNPLCCVGGGYGCSWGAMEGWGGSTFPELCIAFIVDVWMGQERSLKLLIWGSWSCCYTHAKRAPTQAVTCCAVPAPPLHQPGSNWGEDRGGLTCSRISLRFSTLFKSRTKPFTKLACRVPQVRAGR